MDSFSPAKKQRNLATAEQAPQSPDMKYARSRLGDLLHGIRQSGGGILDDKQQQSHDEAIVDQQNEEGQGRRRRPPVGKMLYDMDEDEAENQAVPKMKHRKERKVLFELRGKPFELNDRGSASQQSMSIYQLSRIWLRGREDDEAMPWPPSSPPPSSALDRPPPSADESMDLLATKEIQVLPRPQSAESAIGGGSRANMPQIEPYRPNHDEIDLNSRQAILDTYRPHWKNVKRRWTDYSKAKESRYNKSINLLDTVFNISAQNQLIQ